MRVISLTASALAPVSLASAALYNQVIDTAYGPVQGIPAFSSQPHTNISNWVEITDCLNLNVWTSANSTQEKCPVMIWSYPAGGSAAQPLFDGADMAAKGMVYLNAEMLETVGHNVSGNWAMLGQFAILNRVHENIGAFGGDPERITVAGQSAGSAATYHMLNSPLTKGLIKGAIIESGVRYPRDPLCSALAENYRNMSTALATGETLMSYFNTSSIADLRALLTAQLNAYSGSGGPANPVPVLTGNTRDESGAELPINITLAQYKTDLETRYGSIYAAKFLEAFPAANDSSAAAGEAFNAHYAATSRVGTYSFAEGRNAAPATLEVSIYTYFWTHTPPGQDRGAYRESEINYVLNNLYGTDSPYWANFVKNQDPNVGKSVGVEWKPTTGGEEVVMQLEDGFGEMGIATEGQVGLFREWIVPYSI
ncbi:alpha/beta-hydrolase [Setomelanomma holmii]|uniref:Carboxylic ester hydrolase n=1 Tax=Setomelanomma holmii TaxID=210430 RepID=A0A9P4HFB5_9PLEO|nr:alpha/beta-hydrolase [Setomelanomma holmii]